ncbi:hypothetical protein DUNSADRAFT_13511 [Dunaliella salina]|uniref:Encoded protein n=1 Tax=Dunaliella salina TaxID=3046 RepID=A0ABQ7G9B3_DUNSA|nr:hypothetical protein DUNSADRAFT_13511 [Dunaliella salina]|eukprot:KAF5831154.1 hypothetical protein DUNSADRAFT_13511 [Dunaliella salina]
MAAGSCRGCSAACTPAPRSSAPRNSCSSWRVPLRNSLDTCLSRSHLDIRSKYVINISKCVSFRICLVRWDERKSCAHCMRLEVLDLLNKLCVS